MTTEKILNKLFMTIFLLNFRQMKDDDRDFSCRPRGSLLGYTSSSRCLLVVFSLLLIGRCGGEQGAGARENREREC